MRTPLQHCMKVGIVHFMAFPEAYKNEDLLNEAVRIIARDDFFQAIEVTRVRDLAIRAGLAKTLKNYRLAVGYGAQPVLLGAKHDLNALDEEKRRAAVSEVKECIDECRQIGATRIGLLSGPCPGDAGIEKALDKLTQSLEDICYYAAGEDRVEVMLEVFDRDIDKKCLVGPTSLVPRVLGPLCRRFDNLGLMVDLSHLPLLGETPEESLMPVKEYVRHIHIGNCIMKDKSHPAYGDYHPLFGVEGGENDTPQVREFLKVLLDIGYVGEGKQNIVAFEVKPQPDETSESVVASAKRTLLEAWATL